MSRPFQLRAVDVGARSVPASVGEAIVSAATQAMVNSVQHAGDSSRVKRWVAIKGLRPGGIQVEVGDNGAGFDSETVPTERLGVRVSIVERVGNAGGFAKVVSSPHRGAIITVQWPASKATAKVVANPDAELLSGEKGVAP
jgi:signal transduction histidine kinase